MTHTAVQKESAATIKEKFAEDLYGWIVGTKSWRIVAEKYDQEAFFKEALDKLIGLNGRKKTPALEEKFTKVLNKVAANKLMEDVDVWLNQVQNEQSQRKLYLDLVGQVDAYFQKLATWEFMTKSVTGLAAIAEGKWATTSRGKLEKLEKSLQKCAKELEAAKNPPKDDDYKKEADAIRHAVRVTMKSIWDLHDQLLKISKETDDALLNAGKAVDEQALYNMLAVAAQKEPLHEVRKYVETGVTFTTGVTKTLSPPGSKWISGLVNFFTKCVGRSAEETKILLAVKDAQDRGALGDCYQAFTDQPTLMAQGLARTFNENVELLLAGIGIFSSEIPGWDYIETTVKSCIKTWQKERIKRAESLLKGVPPKTPKEVLQEAFEGGLKTWAEEAGRGLTEALKASFKDGNALGTISLEAINKVGPDIIKKCGFDDASSALEDFKKNAEAVLIAPIVKRVMKIVPVTPAQIVRGEDLTGLVRGALEAGEIPETWRFVAKATSDDTKIKKHKRSELFMHKDGKKVIISNAAKDVKDENGNIESQYVCLEFCGAQLWGNLNSLGEFTLSGLRRDDNMLSDKIRVTADGYELGGTKKTGGHWYRPIEPQISGWYLYKNGDNYEWLRKGQQTLLQRSNDIMTDDKEWIGTFSVLDEREVSAPKP